MRGYPFLAFQEGLRYVRWTLSSGITNVGVGIVEIQLEGLARGVGFW